MAILETLGECIERNEQYFPEELCVVFEDQRITFGQYAMRVRLLADGLYRAGLRSQERVSILSLNRPEFVDLYGACEWAGYIISPLNTDLAPPEIAFVVSDAAPRILIFEDQFIEAVEALRKSATKVETFICLGDNVPSWAISYDVMLASASQSGPPSRAQPGNNLALFYTSGTTGRPKGAIHTHAQQLAFALGRVMETGCNLGDKALVPTPLYHTAARSAQLSHHLRGAGVVLMRRADPARMLQIIESERVTLISVAPTILQMMLDVPRLDQYDLSSLKTIVYGSAPMQLPLLERGLKKFGPVFMCIYAQTESAGTCLRKHHHRTTGTAEQLQRLKSVGQPYLGTKMKIVDDSQQELPRGSIGEVCFKADNVIAGYWRNEAATREALRDGWLHTGDMGYVDADGFLFLVDRKQDMIIVGGNSVYSKEVEDALSQHPAVEQSAVIGVPHAFWGEAVRAIVVPRASKAVDESELIEFTKTLIAGYKCPSSVLFAAELPKLATGKINKPALRERYGAVPTPVRSNIEEPVTSGNDGSTLGLMTKIWESLFERSPIGPDENFFDLGGDSMLAIRLSLEIERLTGRQIPISQFYETPTIAGTTVLLTTNDRLPFSPLALLKDGFAQSPLFIVHGLGGGVMDLMKVVQRIDHPAAVYGLQAKGLEQPDMPYSRIEDMAKFYVEAVKSVQKQGPYFFAGLSFGGLIAIEMTRLLMAEGADVASPILIDTGVHINQWPLADWCRFMIQWHDRQMSDIGKMSPAQKQAYTQLIDCIASQHLHARLNSSASEYRPTLPSLPPALLGMHQAKLATSRMAFLVPDLPQQILRALLLDVDLPPAVLRVHEACAYANARYLPSPCDSKAVLIRCEEPYFVEPETVRFWSKYFSDLEIHTVPGNHFTILDDAKHLAAILSEQLPRDNSDFARGDSPRTASRRRADHRDQVGEIRERP